VTDFFTTLLARLDALLDGDGLRGSARGRTPTGSATKPGLDHAAHSVLAATAAAGRRGRRSAADAVVALQSWAVVVADPGAAVSPLGAPELAAWTGRSAPAPVSLFAAVGDAVEGAIGRAVDAMAEGFAGRWSEPEQARMAGGLFVGAVALVVAGVLGVVTVTAQEPTVHLQRLAAVVNLADPAPAIAVAAAEPATTSTSAAPEAAPAAAAESTTTTATEPPAAPSTTAAPPEAAPVDAPLVARPPTARGGLPIGKGMWIWMEERAEGGDANAIVARAKAAGLTHLYVRTGTLKGGFIAGPFLDRLLPVAHANGLRVYGWDFPYLDHPGDDVNRALAAITYTTPTGHRIDGFSADIESTHEGTNNDLEYVTAYCQWLRDNVGPNYPLIATIPAPTAARIRQGYPYAAVIPNFDAVAPMVYWMNRDPAADAVNAVTYLAQFGKPVFPIGQAYDGAAEGGPPGPPNREAIIRFMQAAEQAGGAGVSFWSYQHATPEIWDAVRDAAEFRLELGGADGGGLNAGMVRAYQTVLTGLGYPVPADGVWGPATADAVRAYQAAARLPVTGAIDEATRSFLLAPVAAPVVPAGH
jgi:hypothetical protein